MTVKEFESLKNKIESAKTNKARAEGALEKMRDQLQKDFDINPEQITDKVEELNDTVLKLNKRKEKVVEKLETVCNWDDIK